MKAGPLIITVVLVFVLALTIWALGLLPFSRELGEIKPSLKPVPPVEPFKSTSRVAIPLRVPLSVLEDALNKETDTTFIGSKKNPIKGPVKKDYVDWTIERGHIQVSSQNQQLILEGPATGFAELTGELRPIGGDLGKWLGQPKLKIATDADVSADIWLAASPILLPNWQIRPNLEVDIRIRRIEAPLQRLGPIDLTPIIRTYLEDEVQKLVAKTDEKLAEAPFLRKEAAKAWNALSRVFPLGKKPRSWLILRPVGIEATQPRIGRDAITISLGLIAETEVVISDTEPQVQFEEITADTLPADLKLLTTPPTGDFALSIPAALDYPAINKEIKRQVDKLNRKNKPIEIQSGDVGTIRLKIEEAKVYPSGTGLLVTARVDATSEGLIGRSTQANLIFEATPGLDDTAQALVLQNPDFSVETRDMLVGSAAWLLKPVVLDALKDSLKIDLAPLAEDAKEKAQKEVNKIRPKLPKGVDFSLDLNAVTLSGVKVGPKALYLLVEGHGPIQISIQPDADLFSSSN